MEVQQLKAFLAVARTGSFSRAAAGILRTQSTVTQSVKALEDELGVRLFDRLGRQSRLTEAGQRLLARAGPLLQQWEDLRSVAAPPGKLRGRVRIGAGEAVVLYLLPGILQRFARKHPEVEIVVARQTRDETHRMLRAGELELGIRAFGVAPPGLRLHNFRTVERVLVMPPGHPLARVRTLSFAKLAPYSFSVPGEGSDSRGLLAEGMAKTGLALRVGLEAGGWEALKRFAEVGLGIAVVPGLAIGPDDRKRLVVRSLGKLLPAERYGLVWRAGAELTPIAAALAREVDRRFNATPAAPLP